MGNPSLTLRRLGLLLGPARVPRLAPARSLQGHFTVHNASAVPARSGSSSSGDVGVIQFSFRPSSFRLLLLSDWPSGRNISAGTWTMYCLAGAGWIPRNITLREYKGEALSAYENCGTLCVDIATWRDSSGYGCQDYIAKSWCVYSYYAPGWMKARGTFQDYATGGVSAAVACCDCGRQSSDQKRHLFAVANSVASAQRDLPDATLSP